MRGILINNTVHTANDLRLVMTAKDLPAPEVQKYTVAVPGRNGLLDLSEFLTGEPTYNNRTLKFEFLGDGSRETVLALIDAMLTYHGQYITVTVDDFKGWYYTGRADVTYSDKGYYVTFVVTVDAQPFSYSLTPKSYTFKECTDRVVTLFNVGVSVIPTVTVETEATIVYGGTTFRLSAGVYEPEELKLKHGDNAFTITSTGAVTIKYREAVI